MFMKKLYFSYLYPVEVHAFSLRFKPVVEPLLATDNYLTDLTPKIDAGINQLANALGIEKGSPFTERQMKADNERDKQYIGARNFIEALVPHPDPAIAQAAQLLDGLFEARDKSLYGFGYAAETSQLNNLLKDLESDAAENAIATINAGIWIDLLKQNQLEFEKVYKEKVDTESSDDSPLATESKNNLARYLSSALDYLDMYSELKPTKFLPIADQLDVIIGDLMTVARTRLAKKKKPPESDN
jgi:hypothetical protein